MKNQQVNKKNNGLLALVIIIFAVLIVLFFYLDRKNELSTLIQTWGIVGIIFAILIMGALCTTPIPSEGLTILLLKIFGVFWGILYSWLGSILSSFIIYYLVHYYGKSFFQKLITPERFETVDHWIKKKGPLGLLIARVLPIPAFIVNYIAAAIPSLKLWPYVWTAALAMLPYYLGTALVYVGVAKSTLIWVAVGAIAIFSFWAIGYLLSRRTNRERSNS